MMVRDWVDQGGIRPLGPERRHYWRVLRMAQATGVDLVGAMENDDLSAADWAGMVHGCRGCAWVEGCKHWLSQDHDDIRDLPDGCVNRTRFAALRQANPEETP